MATTIVSQGPDNFINQVAVVADVVVVVEMVTPTQSSVTMEQNNSVTVWLDPLIGPQGVPGVQGSQGLPGNEGNAGPQGQAGPTGSASVRFDNPTSADIWTINHNLGRRPQITAFGAGGQEIWAEVRHITDMQAIILFDAAVAGYAIYST